jgi:hypothetical protein
VSPSNVWASGWVSNGTSHVYSGGLLQHWNGHRWELRLGHRIPEDPKGIDANGAGVMVVGDDTAALWGHDGRWNQVRTPTLPHMAYLGSPLVDVVWTSGTKAWAAASGDSSTLDPTQIGYILRWDGRHWHHVWRSSSSRSHLTAIDTAGGMTWAIGGTAHGVIVVRRC